MGKPISESFWLPDLVWVSVRVSRGYPNWVALVTCAATTQDQMLGSYHHIVERVIVESHRKAFFEASPKEIPGRKKLFQTEVALVGFPLKENPELGLIKRQFRAS